MLVSLFTKTGRICRLFLFFFSLNAVSLSLNAQSISTTGSSGVIVACLGSPSESPYLQYFTFSATALTSAVSIQAPSNFEISLSSDGLYTSVIEANPAFGSIALTRVYVRAKALQIAGVVSGNVILSSTGAASQNVPVTGTIKSLPVLGPISNTVFKDGDATTEFNFASAPGTTTHRWTNSAPAIGLPATGTGNIPSFTATNEGVIPIEATIKVTPMSTSFAYVPGGSGEISVINTLTKESVTSVTVGTDPNGIAISADGNMAFVTNSGSNNVSVINTLSHQVIKTIPVGNVPAGIVLSADGSRVYVANVSSKSISVIDVANLSVITNIAVTPVSPEKIALNAEGTRLYVISGNEMAVINTITNTEIKTITLGSVLTFLNAVAVSPSTGRIYVLDAGFSMNAVYVIDPVTHGLITTINPGKNPSDMVISPDGKTGYVSATDSNIIAFINLTNNTVTSVSVGSFPRNLALSPDGLWLYAASDFDGKIYSLNTSTRAVETFVEASSFHGNFISAGTGCEGEEKTFTITVNPTPVITVSKVTGTIIACEGTPSSSLQVQNFSLSGSSILSDVTLTSPQNFEISLTPETAYASTVTLKPAAGAIAETLIYIRAVSGTSAQVISGDISISTLSMATMKVGVKGVVNATPVVNDVADLSFVTGTSSSDIIFSGTANTFEWTNSNPEIGLPANGVGHIPSFLANGAESTAIEAMISVHPSSSSYAYITHEGDANVEDRLLLVVDLISNTVIDTISLDFYPRVTLVSADKKWLYVTAGSSRQVTVISTHTNKVHKTLDIAGLGMDMALNPDGSKLYVACRISDKISVINTVDNRVERTIHLEREPSAIEVSPDGEKLYVTYQNSSGVQIIRISDGQGLGWITGVGSSVPFDLALSPDGSRLYVCNLQAGGITVMDLDNVSVITSIPISNPSAVAVSPDNQTIYALSMQHNTLTVIDGATNLIVKTIPVGNDPSGLSVSADGRFVYVTNFESSTLSVISTAGHTVTSTIPMSYRPNGRGHFVLNGSGCDGNSMAFKITIKPVPPTIEVSKASGKVEICYGASSETSDPTHFSISAIKLVSPVTISAPANLEVSFSPATGYMNEITASPILDKLETLKVYVRATTSSTVGVANAQVRLSATGALTKFVDIDLTTHSLPTIHAIDDLSFVSGDETTPITFSGTGSTLDFIWSNNNTSIGLPSNGRGVMAPFIPINEGNTPVTSTIHVAPKSVSLAFIINFASDNVSVINTETKTTINTVAVSDAPNGLAITPAGDKVYVSSFTANDVSVVSTENYSVVGNVKVGQYPGTVLINNSGTLVYVHNQQDNTVSIIDTQTDRVIKTGGIGTAREAMAVSPDDAYLYQRNNTDQQIIQCDALTLQVLKFISIGESNPRGMSVVVSPDGKYVYVTSAHEADPYDPSYPFHDYVSVVNATTFTVEASIPVWQINANHLRISEDGAFLYVMNIKGELVTISTSSNTVVSTTRVAPYAMPFNIHDNKIFIINSSYNSQDPTAPKGNLRIVDITTGSDVSKIYLGENPGGSGSFISRSTGCSGEAESFTITVYPNDYALPVVRTSAAGGTILACDALASTSPNLQHFTLSGSHLTSPIFVSAPDNFEISTTENSNYATSLSIPPVSGSVTDAIIYVRSKPNAVHGMISGEVLITSAGANTHYVFVRGNVAPMDELQPSAIPDGAYSDPYSYTIPGNFTGLTVEATGLPEGLTINNSGSITGTPTKITPSPVDFIVSISNGVCSKTATYSITIKEMEATVFVGDINLIYNGLPRVVSPSTSPSGINTIVTYNGSPDFPVTPGTYTVVATIDDSNYKGTGNGTMTIAKAPLAARANNAARFYGQENAPLTISFTGFVNDETLAVIDTKPTSRTTATAGSNAGSYPITLTGGVDDRYAISLENGTLTVAKAPLKVTADNASRTYGQNNPAFTISYTGFVRSETIAVIDTKPEAGTSATPASNVGEYAISLTPGADNNYMMSLQNGKLIVIPAEQVITLDMISDKLTNDDPFAITAISSASLPIVFSIVSGPATIAGNIISLTGQAGTVTVRATQNGTTNVNPAVAERSFMVGLAVATEPTYLQGINVYPNPVNLSFTVEHPSRIAAKAIHFLDGLGREVDLPLRQVNVMQLELDTSLIPAGLYYLKVNNGDAFRFIKIAVAH